ncbi:YdiU family protein [Paraperlucidibaca wandonensis]|uniref:Protein nucleotidyltransferase YdiU n=1 Tax=Paraperlucidibaca wandonensis TaxID=1268273 RepID=A0ABW3HGX2_9GAMM
MLAFDNSYVTLPTSLWRRQRPTPIQNAKLLTLNTALATELELDIAWWHSPEALAGLAGDGVWSGADPVAMKYAGHQFGGWNPDLGDGRGVLLGEIISPQGQRLDLHLKGSGPTPFSRQGDGRAVLRSSIREYLAGEALHALGVPSTRALAIVSSTHPVRRERMESAATLLRVTPCHIRFGHFEWLFHSNQHNDLRDLADYCIERYYPEAKAQSKPYMGLLEGIIKRTAKLMADWQCQGFAHGVMNTDNFSIAGETLDFGPYGFLEQYDPYLICNHSDHNGRYAWYLQPSVGLWNLNALAQAFTALLSIPEIELALAQYEPQLVKHYDQCMNAKLGLGAVQDGDRDLVAGWLALLQRAKQDYPQRFRWLSEHDIADLSTDDWGVQAAEVQQWLQRYQQRVEKQKAVDYSEPERQAAMQAVNPCYVLRNYLAQQVIEAAEQGDAKPLELLTQALQSPFTRRSELEHFDAAAPEWASCLSISCSS